MTYQNDIIVSVVILVLHSNPRRTYIHYTYEHMLCQQLFQNFLRIFMINARMHLLQNVIAL